MGASVDVRPSWTYGLDDGHERQCDDSRMAWTVLGLLLRWRQEILTCTGSGLRKSSKTRQLLTAWGAEMKQHGTRQVRNDTEVGKITTDYRVLDVRRPIWSLGSMMDAGRDVHFSKNRCWISKRRRERTRHDPQRRSVLRGSQTFKIVFERSKCSGTQSYDISRGLASGTGKGTRGPAAGATLDGDGEPAVRIKVPTGPATPSAEERALHEASGHVPYRSCCQWCSAARATDKPHLRGQEPDTDEAVPIEFDFSDERRNIKYCQFLHSLQSMLVLRACQQRFVPRKHSASIWWKRFWHSSKHLDTMWWCCTQTKIPYWYSCWRLCRADESSEHWWDMVREPAIRVRARLKMRIELIHGFCRAMWLPLEDLQRKKYKATASW